MADLRNTRTSVAGRNAATAAVVALADGGRVRIYSGVQPAAGGAASGTLLWESPVLPTPAFNAPVNGVAALVASQSAPILATDQASWYRVTDSADSPIWDGSVGETLDGDQHNLEVDDKDFVSGGTFVLNTLTYEALAQGV